MSKSYSSRTLTTASVVLALAAIAGRAMSADPVAVKSVAANSNAAKPAASDVAVNAGNEAARVDSYVSSDGAGYFALSLPPVAAPAERGHDIVILFDTSAGQVGAYRDKALEALTAILQIAGEHDRVQLMAVDLNAIPLTESFVAPRSSEMTAAVNKLRSRVPLGATDMGVALGKAADALKGAAQAKSIIYLGDGSSKANALADEYAGLVDRLAKNHIPVISYAIGDPIDATLLAALANQTGGMLVTDSDRMVGKEVGAHLLQMASAPVVWSSSLEMPKELADVYPKKAPPLRSDRDTIVIGKGKPAAGFAVKLSGDAAGKPVNYEWNAQPQKPLAENAYIAQVVDYAQADGGARLPTVGTEGLHEARRLVNLGAQGLAKLSSQAASTGNKEQARVLVEKAIQMDPTNTHAQLVKKQLDSGVVQVAANEGDLVAPPPSGPPVPAGDSLKLGVPAAGEAPLPPPPAPAADQPGALLGQSDQYLQVRIGQIVADVNRELQRDRDRMSQDPSGVIQSLELVRQNVLHAPELPADTRAQLLGEIDGVAQLAKVRERESNNSRVEADRNAAMAKSNQRLQESLQRGQDRLKQIILRMDSLLEEGRYADAEIAASEALKESPDSPEISAGQVIATRISHDAPVAVSAAVNSRYQNFISLNNAYRDQDQRNFLVCMHLVNVSSIPFPDEPPIVYPSADRWRQLTKDRERYRSVDLKNPGSAEAKILKALDEPTEMDFVATPLKDVVEALKIRHGIEIQLDTKALTEASITPDTEVTRQLKGISLKSALRLMLQDMDLNFIIDHEVLLITTEAKAKEKVVTKVYPVADLVLPIAINSGLNPFQSGGGLGGQNGFNSGMNGGMQAGGFGGGGFGGGGGGQGGGFGGGGFGGGGAFDVADPISGPAAKPALHERAARIDVKAGVNDLDAAWNDYFAKLPTADKDDAVSVGRERNAAVRETVRQLTEAKKFGEVAAVLRGALRNGYGQPWMYEALGLAMRADNQPKEEIERVLMSAVQFASTTNDLMFIAVYMSREGFDARALKLFRQAAQLEPTRYEPYMHGLEVALQLKDADGIQWACVGVLSQVWPEDKLAIVDMARHAALATIEDLNAAHRTADAKRFEKALEQALVRDLVVHVSWTGDAEIDMAVQEPSGTVCSYRTPRTASGGVMLSNSPDRSAVATGEGISQDYVATEAFPGAYKILLRRVFGKVSAGKVTVDIYTHFGTKYSLHLRKQIPLGEHDAVVDYVLKDGRRTGALKQAAVAAATQNMLGVNRALLAQMAQGAVPAVIQPAPGQINRNVLMQQLQAINDPAAAAAFANSRSTGLNGNNPNGANGGAVGLLPFAIQGAVGYQPVITTLPEGTNMSATAVVSADRRYVRISVVPLFSAVGDVTTFNFATGAQTVTAGNGGGVGGGPGAGGGGGGGVF